MEEQKVVKICINQFLNIGCPHCKIDRDPSHYPNNLDCPGYKETTICYSEVIRKDTYDKKLVHKFLKGNASEI